MPKLNTDTAPDAKGFSRVINSIALGLIVYTLFQLVFVFLAGIAVLIYASVIGRGGDEAFRLGFMDMSHNRAIYALFNAICTGIVTLLILSPRLHVPVRRGLGPPEELSRLYVPLAAAGFFLSFTARAPFLIIDMIRGTDYGVNILIDLPPTGDPGFFVSALSYLLLTVVCAPVLEELLFRGVILTALRPYGDRPAIIISATAFALIHGRMSDMTAPLFLGILYAIVRIQSGSTRMCIILHAINNAIVYALLLLGAYGLTGVVTAVQLILIVFGAVCLIYVRSDLHLPEPAAETVTDLSPRHAWFFIATAAMLIALGMFM